MIVDDTDAILTQAEFDALPDYSCSVPTGGAIGKQWKRRKDYYDETQGWLLGEYEASPRGENWVQIRWRNVLEVVP